jgi:hypothetical protein
MIELECYLPGTSEPVVVELPGIPMSGDLLVFPDGSSRFVRSITYEHGNSRPMLSMETY